MKTIWINGVNTESQKVIGEFVPADTARKLSDALDALLQRCSSGNFYDDYEGDMRLLYDAKKAIEYSRTLEHGINEDCQARKWD